MVIWIIPPESPREEKVHEPIDVLERKPDSDSTSMSGKENEREHATSSEEMTELQRVDWFATFNKNKRNWSGK